MTSKDGKEAYKNSHGEVTFKVLLVQKNLRMVYKKISTITDESKGENIMV